MHLYIMFIVKEASFYLGECGVIYSEVWTYHIHTAPFDLKPKFDI